jgi:hypothetical protein
MRYAIVINLDYDSNPAEMCRVVWQTIRQRMMEAGFRFEGRLFTAEMPRQQACDVARQVIEGLDNEPIAGDTSVFSYIKEFYGYDQTDVVNLLLPPTDNIEIQEG